MKKNKKTKVKPTKKKSLLGGAAKSLRKLGKGGIGKLSTTQKVVGGALLLGGLGYLAQRRNSAAAPTVASTDTDANTGENLTATEGASI